MNIEEILRKAIAAEAKASRQNSKAVALFESVRPNNHKSWTLLDFARSP